LNTNDSEAFDALWEDVSFLHVAAVRRLFDHILRSAPAEAEARIMQTITDGATSRLKMRHPRVYGKLREIASNSTKETVSRVLTGTGGFRQSQKSSDDWLYRRLVGLRLIDLIAAKVWLFIRDRLDRPRR
jgi:hypothetical protein